ncbi:leucine-rich repeats and immunoglobulin-like domains protein 3 [Scaptodrosophila lebanonensis]|uniref:Leucine-rich repeats and immunoglobulin-like domains protein 3 n=1 Tax=Drosophila lebanonensis TaxID=7225 RepID=A0A6J2U7K6_DROLE|nr:leucine-rich repeats and immunoglobulin-like domains protein 3 [Scaptodrosophila lebanonensis]XP_030384299.1 leucine-rich repeats and immunoglobulin-like domains protein 3 [Scaptodrosophila lebanonensis]
MHKRKSLRKLNISVIKSKNNCIQMQKFRNYLKRELYFSSNTKFEMDETKHLLNPTSISVNWRRRRRLKYNKIGNAITLNYVTTKKLNIINKLLLITIIFLVTTITICQSTVIGVNKTTPTSSSLEGTAASRSSLPLSKLLHSSGSYNMPTQQQHRQQLFATGARDNPSDVATKLMREHFLNFHGYDDNTKDQADLSIARVPVSTASLETTGFVADDGGQYEQAEIALSAAAAATAANSSTKNSCPKECKCLNVLFVCDKVHLERVPILPIYVQTLHLTGNKLNDSSVLDISNLPELHKLMLKRNQLDVIPKFVGLVELKQLNLANNRIQRISREALAALPKLKNLDLSKNQLHSVEANCFVTPNRLAHLILNSNEIARVDENAFSSLTEMTDLELNNNHLYTLPVGVFKNLSRLRKLGLNNNYLQIHWSTFRGLLSLQKLQLRSNNISALPDGVFHVMRNIERIELDHNGISSLSRQGLFNLTKLTYLSLSNNSISRIEMDTWEFTQSLEVLDLSHNNISEFKPQHLDCLQRLKQLNLAHNKLQFLQDSTFDCVKSLEDLNLRRNGLAWIIEDQTAPPPFKSLRMLRKLDLYGNNLKQISSKALSGLTNLELLNLGGNALASIQPNAFEHMLRLQKLIFKSLNFICDCDLLWFRDWLKSHFPEQSQQLQSHVVCGYPEQLQDRELQTLTNADLVCGESPKPVMKQELSNILAVKGANITLECIANSPVAASMAAADELKIKWRHDNHHIHESALGQKSSSTETQIHHDQATNQTTIYGYLRLTNVSYESAGRYQCVASNAFGTTYAQKYKISIGIHPSFLQIPSNLTIDASQTARLVCSATGDPMPEIALQKFGASDFPAATERRLQVLREENAFLITNAKPSDSGIYTCTAESPAGEIKVNATLVVNDKPQPNIPLVRKEVVLGQTCVLECLIDTANAELEHPHREWYKENKPFHISLITHDAERYYFAGNKELLVIINAQSNDAGHYRCEITDKSRTLTLHTHLLVVKESLSQPVILVGVVLLTVACVVVGSCIIWCTLRYQKRKLQHKLITERLTARFNASHNMLSGSRASALDQTQSTTLNRTQLRPHQSQIVLEGVPIQEQRRPRSLTDLSNDRTTRSRLIVTTTPSYEQRCMEQRLNLNYMRQGDFTEQQDHLSSKDSGTGSDAAVKRSLDDFSSVLMHAPTFNLSKPCKYKNCEDGKVDDDGNEDDNELQIGQTRTLGVSVYDDMELYDLNCAAEQQSFLQRNSQCSGDRGAVVNIEPVLPHKCSGNNYSKVKKSATVDI